MKKLFFIVPFLLVLSLTAFADTATDTPTPTITETATESLTETVSPTFTETSTITETFTITPTFTVTPTPQPKIIAYPNPAAYTDKLFIAYPLKESPAVAQRVIIIINAANGDEAGRVYDDSPNGYTEVNIHDYARGIYFYRVRIRYTDGSEVLSEKFKFAIIK
ncbi:MAG: hypothetical protein LLG37_05965 [Spirochaetia bacterium]|nr:hypothetical protein [Spirochaetia bacterium]